MRWTCIVIAALLSACITYAKVKNQSLNNQVTIIKSDNSNLVFEYEVPPTYFTAIKINEQTFFAASIEGTYTNEQPGLPMIPIKKFIIGIPPNGTPNIRITNADYNDSIGINLALYIPSTQIGLKTVSRSISENSDNLMEKFYSINNFYPAIPIASLNKKSIGWLRHQRVMEINFYPIQFDPGKRTVRMFKKVQIEINFNYNQSFDNTAAFSGSDKFFKNIYRSTLVNYDQSLKWRRIPISNTSSVKAFNGIKKQVVNQFWYKFNIDGEGVYAITYNTLLNAGINPALIGPNEIHIYNGGGKELPLDLSSEEPQLQETATFFDDKNNNGRFDPGDRIIFYANGTSGWVKNSGTGQLQHYINYYTKHNVYWLSIGGGQRLAMMTRNIQPPNNIQITKVDKYRANYFREDELVRPDYQLYSGVNWYWDVLATGQTKTYSINLHDVYPNDTSQILIHLMGWTEVPHPLTVSLNDAFSFSAEIPYTLEQTISNSFVGGLLAGENQLVINLNNSPVPGSNLLYLDWLEIHYWSSLRAENDQLVFDTPSGNGFYEYEIKNFDADTAYVFDITDPFNVQRISSINYDLINSILRITDSISANVNHKIITVSSEFINPVAELQSSSNPLLGLRDTTNGADYLVIVHPSLTGYALNQLVAHIQSTALLPNGETPTVKVVNVNDIYDEFAWGMFDPAAIRNFLRYTYFHWQKTPTYVLLVGKACFDYKNNFGRSLPNLIPTYEGSTIGTDDWFVYLTQDELMDMIIGRLPTQTQDDLNTMVNKIINYDTKSVYGFWKNTITMAADDEFSPNGDVSVDKLFTINSEDIVNTSIPSSYKISKVYLMAYPQRDIAGNKPAAQAAFITDFNNGSLILNYIGHGNYVQLAHETVFYAPTDITKIHNGDKLPVFVAATCEAGRFDGNTPELECISTRLLDLQGGGSIAGIASTRWGLSTANFLIDKAFIEQVLGTNNIIPKTFGEAMVIAKTTSDFKDFTQMINLLGLPSEYIDRPQGQISFSQFPDTISEFKTNRISGEVYQDGIPLNNFSGNLEVETFDSDVLKLEPGVNVNYSLPGHLINDQTWNINQGKFDSTYILMNDSLYGGDLGRIFVYARGSISGQQFDAAGSIDSITVVPNITSVLIPDSSGPTINISVNGSAVINPNVSVGFDPKLVINIMDEGSGINLNQSFGIHLIIDGDSAKMINLTQYYSGDLKEGKVQYILSDLTLGLHKIDIAAWDKALNKSERKFELLVGSKDLLSSVYSYPNPAGIAASFTFYLNQNADITIKIFSVSGRLIRVFQFWGKSGFNVFPQEPWNLRDEDGDLLANGIYFYKIIALSNQGESAEALGKMAIVR